MRHFAIVGSGPAGFYTAEALAKAYGEQARIAILDRYPVPYGLIRFGVAPDHQSLKAVSRRYDKVAEEPGVGFIGNVTVGVDVSVRELLGLYDAVILAIGAPHDRKLGIPGEDLPGVVGSAEFVGWYNGHPDFADLDPPLNGTHAGTGPQPSSTEPARNRNHGIGLSRWKRPDTEAVAQPALNRGQGGA